MERNRQADQACSVAVAAAQDLNSDLTIMLSSVSEALCELEAGHPARPFLLDIQSAAQRCARRAAGLLTYGQWRGVRGTRAPFEALASILP